MADVDVWYVRKVAYEDKTTGSTGYHLVNLTHDEYQTVKKLEKQISAADKLITQLTDRIAEQKKVISDPNSKKVEIKLATKRLEQAQIQLGAARVQKWFLEMNRERFLDGRASAYMTSALRKEKREYQHIRESYSATLVLPPNSRPYKLGDTVRPKDMLLVKPREPLQPEKELRRQEKRRPAELLR